MGHWVTLDDDQHVYISDGGKVLATRGAISAAAKGKEHVHRDKRGKQSAPGVQRTAKLVGTIRAARSAAKAKKAKGRGTPERMAMAKYYREDRANTVAAKAALAKATASTRNPVTTQGVELTGKPGNAPQIAASKFKVPTELKVPEKVRAAALAKSNATMREQARAAGWVKVNPKKVREQADKARAAKGDIKQRTQALIDKANKKYAKAVKGATKNDKTFDAAVKAGQFERADKLAAKAAPYLRTKQRLMAHKTRIDRLIKSARNA